MTTQTPRPAADSDGKEATSADAVRSQPDPIAISPAIGPLPAIYVPRAGDFLARSESHLNAELLYLDSATCCLSYDKLERV